MDTSFIVYFCSSRLDNLKQMLRLLYNRDQSIAKNSELVLVCQDECHSFGTGFSETKFINLNSPQYNKGRMNNIGVAESKGDILVLLDSDRVLPDQYFEKNVKKVKSQHLITTQYISNITHEVSDENVLCNDFEFRGETRSQSCDMFKKNMFSGNTIMLREDYYGFDEEYVGYGYADTDMSMSCLRKGCKFVFNKEKELHLFHKREDEVKFKMENLYNAIRYCKKWGLEPPPSLFILANRFKVDVKKEMCCGSFVLSV